MIKKAAEAAEAAMQANGTVRAMKAQARQFTDERGSVAHCQDPLNAAGPRPTVRRQGHRAL